MAAVVVRRRCASAPSDVKRIPIASVDADGAPCLVRARTEQSRGNRQSAGQPATLGLEIDLPTTVTTPARRVDVRVPGSAADVKHWLGMLARGYVVDECVASRGTWGDARLVLEDRGAGKFVLEARVPDDIAWVTPAEWEGAVDVTDLPAWGRAILTVATWPEPGIAARVPSPAAARANAWGAPLDPASGPCDDTNK